jgi:hypothetical protein
MGSDELRSQVEAIAARLRDALATQVVGRYEELKTDDTAHHELYEILGVPPEESPRIDLYQNVGRFVYKYAGALLEETTKVLLSAGGTAGSSIYLDNTVSTNPARFEIDCFTPADNKAHEIKWRDATTDGDHIRKEHNKIQTIVNAGHVPVRVMYYMPVRAQARRIQERILSLFRESGEAYVGNEAWSYVQDYSGVDLQELLTTFKLPHEGWLALGDELADEAQ